MDYIRDALVRMVKSERQAHKLWDAMNSAGFDDASYFDIAGNIGDAIYCLIGENTEMYSQSVTYKTLRDNKLSDVHAADVLMEAMRKNYEQPKPTFMNRKAFRKSVKQNGGYMTPEGDWT